MNKEEFVSKYNSDSEFREQVKLALKNSEKLATKIGEITNSIAATYMWFQEFFPKIEKWLSQFFYDLSKFVECTTEYQKIAERFNDIIYKTHWFHCSFFTSVNDFESSVIDCYEKNHENGNVVDLIDNLFFDFYDTKLDDIIEDIDSLDNNKERVMLIKQAIGAYKSNNYFLTITSLMTVFDRLVYERTTIPAWHNQPNLIQRFEKLTDRHRKTLAFIACSHYREQIVNEVYENDDINKVLPITGIPNRHMITHGFQYNYATKKTALNSIIMIGILYCLSELDNEIK